MNSSVPATNVLRLSKQTVLTFRERFGECIAFHLDNGQQISFLRGCSSPDELSAAVRSTWPHAMLARGETSYRAEGSTRAIQMLLDITGRILVQVSNLDTSHSNQHQARLNHGLPSEFEAADITINDERMSCMGCPPCGPDYYRQGFEIDLEPGMSTKLRYARVALSTIHDPMADIYDQVVDGLRPYDDHIERYTSVWDNVLSAVADVHFLRASPQDAVQEHLLAMCTPSNPDLRRLADAVLSAITKRYLE